MERLALFAPSDGQPKNKRPREWGELFTQETGPWLQGVRAKEKSVTAEARPPLTDGKTTSMGCEFLMEQW